MSALNRRIVAGCLPILLCGACASHGPVHVAPDESRPHVSWEIRTGGEDGDSNFVCGSTEAARLCELAASTESTRTLATVHLFVHAAAEPANYLGFMRGAFFEGEADRKIGEVKASVEPGSRPVSAIVVGRVTSKPGAYTFVISVDAKQSSAPTPVHISHEVPVVVK